jgi:hypothetical protein
MVLQIAGADDLHMTPFREDGVTYGMPAATIRLFRSLCRGGGIEAQKYQQQQRYTCRVFS